MHSCNLHDAQCRVRNPGSPCGLVACAEQTAGASRPGLRRVSRFNLAHVLRGPRVTAVRSIFPALSARRPLASRLVSVHKAAVPALPSTCPSCQQWRFAPACCAAQSAWLRLSLATQPLPLQAPPCVFPAPHQRGAPSIQNSPMRVAIWGSALARGQHRGASKRCRLTLRSTGAPTACRLARAAQSAYHAPHGPGATPSSPG